MTGTATNDEHLPTTFTDTAGGTWRVRLTLGLLGRIRRELGFNLGKILADPQLLAQFETEVLGDPETFGSIVWLLVEDQAKAAGVDQEAFYAAFDGDTVIAASAAIVGAVSDFTRPRKTSGATKKVLGSMLARMDEEMARAIETRTADPKTWSGSAGSSPDSPGSTGGTSGSASSSGPPTAGSSPSGSAPPPSSSDTTRA